MAEATIVGIIGGTGLYEMPGLTDVETLEVNTPFGQPSSTVTVGRLDGVKLLFLARHGTGHGHLPSEINYRANIYALKRLGATWCLSLSAVGSLKQELEPGHVVVPDQFIDRTTRRISTFFGNGIVGHIPFALPFCPVLRELLYKAALEVAAERKVRAHDGGVYLCMEGPAFSTRAESLLYKSWGASLIGMTNLPEAKLAREAEIAYATLALVTDYDCWHEENPHVDYSMIVSTLQRNADLAKEVIRRLVPRLPGTKPSELASEALKTALVTHADDIPYEIREMLEPIIGRYLK